MYSNVSLWDSVTNSCWQWGSVQLVMLITQSVSLGATVMWSTCSYTQTMPAKRPVCTWSYSLFADLLHNSVTHWPLIVRMSVIFSLTICWLFKRLMPGFNRDAAVQASSLLESIPKMFCQTQHADACVGAAVQASIDTLKVCFAVALVLQTSSACHIFQAACRPIFLPSNHGSTC